MRIKFPLCVSMLAMSIATSAPAQTIDWKIFAESFISSAHAQHGDWQKVDETLGRKPAITGDVSRYDFPRSDLTVTLDGVTIKPSLALGGWIAFKPMHDGPMVMGDLVLLETGINPVMTKLIEGGTVDEAPAKQGTTVAITQGTAGAREPATGTLRGVIDRVDQGNDTIKIRLSQDKTGQFKVQDGLIFDAVRYGDQVEVTVQNIAGAKAIVGLKE
jgi:Domain of Unknown Function (DUF1259)